MCAKKNLFSFMAIIIFFSSTVFATMIYPSEFEGKISQYPDSTIVQTMKMEKATHVVLKAGDTLKNAILFYTKNIKNNGLHIDMETRQENYWTVVLSGKEGKGMVGIHEEKPGELTITLMFGPK